MTGADSKVVGIRLRKPDGSKFAVRGGKQGLFIPTDIPNETPLLLITEGPTDCAALLDLGFDTIGRPSCNGGVSHVLGFILADHRFVPREVVIVADGDGPGQQGAWSLASMIVSYVPVVRVITPPAGSKDIRAWKNSGATHDDIAALIEDAPAMQISYGVKAVAR